MKDRVTAIIRLLVAFLPAVNMILIYFGKSPLPFSEDEINMAFSAVVEVFGILWAWWKNNNMTHAFQISQKIGEQIKNDQNKVGGEGDPLEVE